MPEPMLQSNLMRIVLGSYTAGPATALSDPTVLPQVQHYKRQVASQFLPVARHDIGGRIPDTRCLVSRKIDGEFNALVFRDGEIFSVNPGGTVRTGLPFMQQAQEQLARADVTDVVLAGELYFEPASDLRSRVHDVISVLRHPKNEAELGQLRFACFDLITLNRETVHHNYGETWHKLSQWISGDSRFHLVPTREVESSSAIDQLFRDWVESQSAEGLVVRSDTAGNFKLKPLFSLDAVVIGFTESTDDRTGLMHDLLLALRRTDGAYHVLGRVGGGFSEQQRREMLSDLKDMVVDSEYAEVNSDHVAYQMVRPEWVVEISCLDVVAQNTRGRPVNRMALQWDTGPRRYRVIRRLPLASVISPQFVRLREDKTVRTEDVRIQQLQDIVPIEMSDVDATELTLPRSRLLQREVYVKTIRGEKLVRKFLLWKTNKENESDNYPAYVAYHSDFSPSRKVPLTREIRVSSSETQILALWHQLKEENIKQGWELHTDTAEDLDRIARQYSADQDPPTKPSENASPQDAAAEQPAEKPDSRASSKKNVKQNPASLEKTTASTKKSSTKKSSTKKSSARKKKT